MILNHVILNTEIDKGGQKMVTIAELRARNCKMSQKELANKLDVDVSSIVRWEKDITTISATSLKKLALFFNVSADDLLGISKKIS